MCRSANDPNGPYRCSYDMKNILLSTKSHYAQAVQDYRTVEDEHRKLSAQVEDFQQVIDSEGLDVSKKWIDDLEHLQHTQAKLEEEKARLADKVGVWQEKLKKAQLDYDSTRGGIQDLCEEYNDLLSKAKDPKLSEEEKAALLNKADMVHVRMNKAIGIVREERAEPLQHEAESMGAESIDYTPIDNSRDTPDVPDGDESDALITPEMNEALDAMIDDLGLSAVDKKYMGIIDEETGEEYDLHEIQVIARKNRQEARLRIKRQKLADGDTREVLRSFLRHAVFRVLRYNKGTRKLMRLIGIRYWNQFLEKSDEIQDEYLRDKKQRKDAINRQKQEQRVQEMFDSLEEDLARERSIYNSKRNELRKDLNEGKISRFQYDQMDRQLESELNEKIRIAEQEQTEIELIRAQWAMEKVEQIRNNEKRIEQIKQAIIEKKRKNERDQELLDAVV